MAPLEQMLALLADPFDQDLESAAHQAPTAGQSDGALRFEQCLVPIPRRRGRHPAAQLSGRRALLAAVDEGSQVVEAGALDELQQIVGLLPALAREPDDEVAGKTNVRSNLSQATDTRLVLQRCMPAFH